MNFNQSGERPESVKRSQSAHTEHPEPIVRLGIGSSGNAWRPAHATQWEANGKCLAVRDPCTNKQQNPPPAGPGGFACRPGYRSGGFETAGRWVGRQWAYVMKSLGQNRKSFGYGRPAKDEADLSSLRGAHEARQATALARPQAARGSAVSVHRLRACRYDRVARVRR